MSRTGLYDFVSFDRAYKEASKKILKIFYGSVFVR